MFVSTLIPLVTKWITIERKQPDQVALSLLEKLPGQTLAGKSSSFLIGASVASWLISKEIYIVDAEFFEMICLFGAYYVWYSSGKGAAADYFKEKQDVFFNY